MVDYASWTRRRIVPSIFQQTGKLINVAPVSELQANSYEEPRLSNTRSFDKPSNSSDVYPQLWENLEDISSVASNSNIIHVASLFTPEMGKRIQDKSTVGKSSDDRPDIVASHPDSFFSSMRPFMYLAQVFAFMPVTGINGANHRIIRFRWLHWRLLYTLITIAGIIFIFICSVHSCMKQGLSYDSSAPLAFYGSGIIGYILFLELSRKWSDLNEKYVITEYILKDHSYPKGQKKQFMVITIIFGFTALVEHILSLVMEIMRTLPCRDDSDDVDKNLEIFFRSQYQQVFGIVNYNIVLAIYVFTSNFLCTCCWNFMDLFLGLMGMSLSSRLRQINDVLRSVHGQEKPTIYWRKIREEFNAVSVLIKAIDSDIQKIMLLSLGDNLFFICLQLLKSLQKRTNIYQITYFFWSFGFLISRLCFVTMCAAGVYDESKESKTVLFSVPHQSFCYEVRRFLTQLSTDELTLTGCRFFSVTRGLILTIAGTVVTYEIVLLQFKNGIESENWPIEGNKTHCPIISYYRVNVIGCLNIDLLKSWISSILFVCILSEFLLMMKVKSDQRKTLDFRMSNTKSPDCVESIDHPNSFFVSMRPAILLAQYFGHFYNLHNLNGPSGKLQIKWLTWRTVFAAYGLFGNCLFIASSVYSAGPDVFSYEVLYYNELYCSEHHNDHSLFNMKTEILFSLLASVFFYSVCLLMTVYLIRLSSHWPLICHDVAKMEILFYRHGYPNKIGLKFKILLPLFMLTAAVEHLSGLFQGYKRSIPCAEDLSDPYDVLAAFFHSNYKQMYHLIGFHFWAGFVCFHFNILFTFTWNFVDVFLAFIAMTISARLKQLNKFLLYNHSYKRDQEFWRQARLEFNCLSTLTKKFNRYIGDLVVISLLNNVFFICLQLYRAFQPRRNVFQRFYYFWSFFFLTARTLFSSFSLAEVHNCSKVSMTALFCVPSESYHRDVRRLLLQMSLDTLAFSGRDLFVATRRAILTIFGSIVTYVVVLLQFNTRIEFDYWPTNNSSDAC